ncbi:MAG TPA: ATP-binding cassette domain-containing protein [Phenylobacterium sp.]|uniref:ABC transporter ATP-binding protein n=1 Tax=Phenylobacterium sp. TaxID=1871053 RepID=UPI002D48AB02|nr:ATP-binding cassette domain-containing protein [Phenylobacterium sp.]HZZ67515.1 ATP-binding cassette domain-containing protein [Phenylobacterium sp.]
MSFEVPQGGIFGFLGANGAGKTTTLRMVLDILRPTEGVIEVLGRAPGRRGDGEIGFLPEERGLYRQMTALETVVYFGRLKGMAAPAAQASAEVLIERFGLTPFARRKVDQLSKGMAQKVQLATALVTTPRLLILDEPFAGLDPVNQAVLEEMVLDLVKAGSTVVFSTHVMQHAERLCDRLLLIARGRKVFQGSQDEARAQLPARLSLTARADPRQLPGVEQAQASGAAGDGWTDWEITLTPGAGSGALLEACTASGFALRRFETRRATLHEVFLHLVGGEAAATPPTGELAEARP